MCVRALVSSRTECPSNATVTPTLAATRPQHNSTPHRSDHVSPGASDSSPGSFFTRLISIQFQSYSTALTATIVVGCFLLLLNILIFAAIYYQREKRANDARKKEQLTEVDGHCSPNSINCRMETRRKKSLQNLSGFDAGGSFGEYSCYDDKISCKEKHLLADICSVEIPMRELKCSVGNGSDSNTGSLRRGAPTANHEYKQAMMSSGNNSLLLYPPTYSSPRPAGSISEAGSSNSSELVTYHQFQQQMLHEAQAQPAEQCNQATQSDIPDLHDVGTTVMEHEVDAQKACASDASMLPPPPPPAHARPPNAGAQSSYQGGILRQQGGPTTPSATKKRVQIQEISV